MCCGMQAASRLDLEFHMNVIKREINIIIIIIIPLLCLYFIVNLSYKYKC